MKYQFQNRSEAENTAFLISNNWYCHDDKWRNDVIMPDIPYDDYGVNLEAALLIQSLGSFKVKYKFVKLSEIKVNPKNPRIIKDTKYKKLVKSIQDFPEMLEIRPIVVDQDMMVLGGNMRLKACEEASLIDVPIIIADNLTESQQKEFLIKDNLGFGEWDWDMLANEWDTDLLEDWGLDGNWPDEEQEEEQPEEKTYVPVFRFEVTCQTEAAKNKLMADLLMKGYSCTEDY